MTEPTTDTVYGTIEALPKRRLATELESVTVTDIDEKESGDLLAKTKVEGSMYKETSLTVNDLKEAGLRPHFKIDVDGSSPIFVSSPYDIEQGRRAFTAYVDYSGRLKARTFYRSNSQGIWRYLPDYSTVASGPREGEFNNYGKWSSSVDNIVNLAFPLQSALSNLLRNKKLLVPQIPKGVDPMLLALGTVFDRTNMGASISYVDMPHVSPLPGNFHSELDKLLPPETLTFQDPKQEPDFDKVLVTETRDMRYGGVQAEVFPSMDNSLRFIFCKDKNGRVWIGGVENGSPMKNIGVRESVVNAGDLTTPPVEYYYVDEQGKQHDSTGGFGNKDKREGTYYVDMFDNYLNKIPVIQRYLKERV